MLASSQDGQIVLSFPGDLAVFGCPLNLKYNPALQEGGPVQAEDGYTKQSPNKLEQHPHSIKPSVALMQKQIRKKREIEKIHPTQSIAHSCLRGLGWDHGHADMLIH